jgi:hypothetical protein
MRTMVATMALSGLLAAGLAAAAVTTATAQDSDAPAAQSGAGDQDLVQRLVELERQLPAMPPSAIDLFEDETWGDLRGDFLGARTQLGLIADQARQLFVTADDGRTPVAEAVSSVARSYLRLHEAMDRLARYRDHDLARPTGATDDRGVATGADTASSHAEAGLALIELARMDALMGYGVLRDSEAADDAAKTLFDQAYRETQQYLTAMRPDARRLVSADTTAIMVAVDRFDTGNGQARARTVEYVCVPREMYPFGSSDPIGTLIGLLSTNDIPLLPAADCPDLPDATLVTPIAP